MRIEGVEACYVELPLLRPWRSANRVRAETHSVLLRMLSDGHEAWSEATPFYAPTYSTETVTSAFFRSTESFAPRLVGRETDPPREHLEHRIPCTANRGFKQVRLKARPGWHLQMVKLVRIESLRYGGALA